MKHLNHITTATILPAEAGGLEAQEEARRIRVNHAEFVRLVSPEGYEYRLNLAFVVGISTEEIQVGDETIYFHSYSLPTVLQSNGEDIQGLMYVEVLSFEKDPLATHDPADWQFVHEYDLAYDSYRPLSDRAEEFVKAVKERE